MGGNELEIVERGLPKKDGKEERRKKKALQCQIDKRE